MEVILKELPEEAFDKLQEATGNVKQLRIIKVKNDKGYQLDLIKEDGKRMILSGMGFFKDEQLALKAFDKLCQKLKEQQSNFEQIKRLTYEEKADPSDLRKVRASELLKGQWYRSKRAPLRCPNALYNFRKILKNSDQKSADTLQVLLSHLQQQHPEMDQAGPWLIPASTGYAGAVVREKGGDTYWYTALPLFHPYGNTPIHNQITQLPNGIDLSEPTVPNVSPERGHRYIPEDNSDKVYSLILSAGGKILK